MIAGRETPRTEPREIFVPARRSAELVRVPAGRAVSVMGTGSPESDAFREAIAALYAVTFTLKFTRKKEGLETFRVAPLEGLWWGPRPGDAELLALARDHWRWKLLIRVPESVTDAEMADAKASLHARRRAPPATYDVTVGDLAEELVVQILHVGPYASEDESLNRIRTFMAEHRLTPVGPHHEVYLGDPRRSNPARLRTILRQAVAPHAAA